jgi:uncharacterized protein YqgV (UPF0045/DUF77 family)
VIGITAQVSLYPLPQEALAPEIGEALQVFRECALEVEPNAVSSLLVGDDTTIFAALQQAFCHAAEQGKVVMVVTLSNACPAPGRPSGTVLES